MTDVNKTDTRLIASVEDARALYAPPPARYTGLTGIEVELPFYKPGPEKPVIPTAEEMLEMQRRLKQRGFDAQLEPSGVAEYTSPAVRPADVARLVETVKADLAVFEAVAEDMGYSRAPFCLIPTTTMKSAFNVIANRERLRVSLQAMAEIFPPETSRGPMLTTSVQTSFSPRDADEMFGMAYRAYAMTPLLMAMSSSSSGFILNEDKPLDYFPRGKYYEGYGMAGGIAQSFLQSSNGAEFVDNHIKSVFEAPMHFAYDLGGNIIRASRENPLTFQRLVDWGLNTRANYELAETFLYNDVKVCNLRDENGAVVGKRLEVRAADSGSHQPVSAPLLTVALVAPGETAEKFEKLLQDYGFTGDPRRDAPLFRDARRAAVEHGGKFMDVAFGRDPETGAPLSLRDFAQDVAGLVADHYAGQKLGADLVRLTEILVTGESDAKRYAREFPTLADAARFLQKEPSGPRGAAVAEPVRKVALGRA